MKTAIDEHELAISRVYAEALLKLAQRQGRVAEVRDELAGVVSVLDGDADLERLFSTPLVDTSARERLVERIFRGRASDLLTDTLQIMNRKGRLRLVRALAETFRRVSGELEGRVDVEVTTAVPLSDEQRARLAAAAAGYLARVTGERKSPRLVEQVDEDLVGGIVIRIGDQKIDGSVSKELAKVGNRLEERASHEIYSTLLAGEA